MPSTLINKVSGVCKIPLDQVEKLWDKAKGITIKSGVKEIDKDFYPFVVGVFKKILGNDNLLKLGWYNKMENKADRLLSVISEIKDIIVKGIKYDLEGEVQDIYSRLRSYMNGISNSKAAPLQPSDVGEAEQWCSEYPGIHGHFNLDKTKTLEWVSKLAYIIYDNTPIEQVNDFLNIDGLPSIVPHLAFQPTTTGEFV